MGKFLSLLSSLIIFGSISSSSHYQLQSFSVNSGGTNSAASTTYHAQAAAGQVVGNKTLSATYSLKSGEIAAQGANVPGAPTLSNGGGTYYNKINFVLDTGNNPTDATFAVEVDTSSSFSSPRFVQIDGSLSTSAFYQTYSQWGGASGSLATNLSPNTTYYFRASAKTGQFTASAFGPSANMATVNPALSFSLSPSSVNLGQLNAGSIVTGAINATFSTNAYNGGYIYLSGSYRGLFSVNNFYLITAAPPSGDLSSLSEGFGVQSQSASGGVSAQSPYDGSASVVGSVNTTFTPLYSASAPVSSSAEALEVLAKAKTSTPAGTDYSDTLTFVAAANY